MVDIAEERERIKGLFEGVDEKKIALVEGAIEEAARLRFDLDRLHEIAAASGLVKYNPANPAQQKELPVSRMLPKVRAAYINYIYKLGKILDKNVAEEDMGLDDYV